MINLLVLLAAAALTFPALAEQADNSEPIWSSAIERFLASHWVAGHGADAADGSRRFLMVCDPKQGSYLRSLRELNELRAEYRKDPKAWAEGRSWHYTCISRNSLRLVGPTNLPLPRRVDPDEEGINEGYYRVVREDADSQLIELHYRDRNAGIYDSFYKYEVRGDQVVPLESWVWGRGNFQVSMAAMLAAIVLLVVMVALHKPLRLLFRRIAGNRRRNSGQ